MPTRTTARPAPASSLPEGLEPYRRTPVFTEDDVPAGLLRAHATRAGVWGLIHVLEGELLYRVLDERRAPASLRLGAGSTAGIVESTIVHEVEPLGRVRFQVEFFRDGGPS